MKRPNHSQTIEEHLQYKKHQLPKQKKLNGPRKEKIDGFEVLDDNLEIYMNESGLITEFDFPERNPTLIDLILYYFDNDFLDLMIKENVEVCEWNGLPPIFAEVVNSKRRDIDEEKRKFLLRFIATRFYIMFDDKKHLVDNWPMKNDKIESSEFLGRDNFQKMIGHMLMRLNIVEEINIRLARYVKSGRHVSLDEKHKGCKKDKYLSRWVHGKDPSWGHWITELITIAPKTGMPILLKLMPLTSTEPKNVTIEPFNNYNLVDVHKEIVDVIREGTIIVEDAYYLDDPSRKVLRENNIPYLASINKVRFKEIWDVAEEYVKKKGDWIVLYNEGTKEHAMMKWEPVGEKTPCLD